MSYNSYNYHYSNIYPSNKSKFFSQTGNNVSSIAGPSSNLYNSKKSTVASKYGSSSSSQYSKKVTPVSSIYDNIPSSIHTNKKSYVSNIHDNITSENTQGKKLLSKSLMPDYYGNYDLEDIYDKNYYSKNNNDSNNKKSSKYSYNNYYNTKDSKEKNDYNSNNDNINNNNIYNETSSLNRELNSIINSTIGLNNLGNTCFMNTCLQNLIHSEYFIKRLISKKSSISRSTPITYYFFNLCQELSISSRAVSPSKFKEKFGLKHHLFAGYGQNDTQEFCRVLLEDMNSELNEVKKKKPYVELTTSGKSKIQCDKEFDENFRGRENSIVMDSFYGQIINIFTCKCNFKDYSFQKVLDLPLLLQSSSSVSIMSLLEDYFEDEKIKFETKCEKCGKKTVHLKEIRFSQPPNILILSLQRINPRTKRKNSCAVSFPEILDINKFIDGDCGHSKEGQYILYGIGNHSGTINFGHYYAYIKLNDKYWYEFNDSYVRRIGDINNNSTTAYTLFYKKRN